MDKENEPVPRCEYSKDTIKTILASISEAQIAYDSTKQSIDFDIAVKGLKPNTYDDLLAVLENFCDLKQLEETVSEANLLAIALQNFYDTIERLKYIPGHGETAIKSSKNIVLRKDTQVLTLLLRRWMSVKGHFIAGRTKHLKICI